MRSGTLLLLASTVVALAGPNLYLKSRVIDTGEGGQLRSAKNRQALAETTGRIHLLVQFDHAPGDEDARRLGDRGVVVLSYVHENGLVVAAQDPRRLQDLGLQWMGKLEAADKISPLLMFGGSGEGLHPVLIEIHSDVNMNDVRQIALEAGAVLADNPDLTAHHLLASMDSGQIATLADRDEVAYIFPASGDLVSGQPGIGCAGALTTQGAAGQYVGRMGDGWGGSAKNAANIGYYFSDLTSQLPDDSVRSEIVRAFAEWARYVKITFTATSKPDASQSINVLFTRRDHGDGFPFDGPGPVLAHTFYPAPPNPEPLAGDMHFNDDDRWRIGSDTDLFSVALHEAGHALGLGHSDRPGAVMYPYYARATGLTPDDIAAIQELYAAQDSSAPTPAPPANPPAVPAAPAPPATPPPSSPGTPVPAPAPAPPSMPLSLTVFSTSSTTTAGSVTLTGSTSGGAGGTLVSWRTDRGQSGLAQGAASAWSAQAPLVLGANSIAITATDAQRGLVTKSVIVTRQPSAAPAAVAIQFNYPAANGAFSTTQPTVTLQGTASHASGVRAIRWSSDRGYSGQATGAGSWDTGPVGLQPGVNTVTIQATANDGSTGNRVVEVSYAAGIRDTTAPALTITSPDSVTFATTADSIVMRGTARDNVGVTEVTWFTSTGDSGHSSGTTNWETAPIPLIRGYNSIVVRAFDAAGNVGWRVVTVTRQ